MAAATIAGLMAGIESQLDNITGLRAKDTAPDTVDIPSGGGYAFVGLPHTVEYHATMANGHITPMFTVMVLVAATPSRAGQALLAGYLDPGSSQSIRAAVEADPTLGGAAEDCRVMVGKTLGQVELAGVTYLGAEFTLQTVALGA